ncbi:hypothetical protein LCGC14_2865670 [marine sediment metagenome]|uniref:DUF5672 domain-containing protein n=1 Tax=marine sediment metagenome TaxID=412755 RepID=A0A0F8Y4N1_9ZZZZ
MTVSGPITRSSEASTTSSVLVSVPTTGWVHKHVVFALLRLQLDRRYKLRIILPTHSPFENNLHHIVADFMDGGEDYWLSIDTDNPPIQNPLDLVALDKDILGFPTPVWHWEGKAGERPIYWNAYRAKEGGYTEYRPQSGLQRVDAVGTGCFLIARRVFEDVEMRKGPFLRTMYPDGRVEKGNDIAFCERARARDWEIWTHFGYPCRHFNEVELTEVIAAFKGLGVK